MSDKQQTEDMSLVERLDRLPAFYLFPQWILSATQYRNFPRNPYIAIGSKKWLKAYHSDKFLENVIDGTAHMVWKHFGIKASLESFSGYYPFWMIARMGDWQLECKRFFLYFYKQVLKSPDYSYPVLDKEKTDMIFQHFVEKLRKHSTFDAMLEVVRETPCHEDYEPSRFSKARIDFYRRWYHSRSVTKVEFVDFDSEKWEQRKGSGANPWKDAFFQMDFEEFKQTLSDTDRQIIEMLYCGYTQVQIARALGYANHSAVCKRAAKIGRKYREYTKAAEEPATKSTTVKDNWDEMTRLLYPKAKQPNIR